MTTPSGSHYWFRWVAVSAFCIVVAVGILVMVAWHLHLTALVQVNAAMAPVQYNTALCFVFCGAAQLLLLFGYRRPALVAGALVTVFSGLTLAEHVTNANLGIDQLFINAYVTTQTPQPGRMSPVTALCFVLAGIAILSRYLELSAERRVRVAAILNSVILAVSVTALAGYATGLVWTYAVGNPARMPIHTAATFAMLSIGCLAELWTEERRRGFEQARWLPLAAGLAVTIATLMVWQALVIENANQIRQEARLAAESLRSQMKQGLETRVEGLIQMVRRWEIRHGTPRKEWEDDATLYVEHFAGYQAIEWIDSTFHVQWIVPLKGNEAAQNLNVAFEPKRRAAVEAARDLHKIVISRVIDLVQGGKGFLVQVPVFDGGRFAGLMTGVFSVPRLFEAVRRNEVISRYSVVVFDGSNEVYKSVSSEQTNIGGYAQQIDLEFHGVKWHFVVEPEPALIIQDTSALPDVVLAAGLGLAVLLMLTLHWIQVALARAYAIDAINLDLHKEVVERTSAQVALKESETRFQEAFQHASIGMALVAPDGRWLRVNRALCEMVGYSEPELMALTFQDITHPDDLETDLHFVRQILAGEILTYQMEKRYFHRGAQVVHVLLSVSLVRTVQGAPLYFVSQIQNISERKAAENALRDSEERLHLITDNMPALIAYVDAQERYRFNNRLYRDWFGAKAEDLEGRTVRDLLGEQSYEFIRPQLEIVFSGKAVHFERELIAEGKHRYIEATYLPHFGVEGQVLGFYGFAYDTTERHHAENALRQSEERLRLITDNIPGLVSYIDREKKFRFANHRYREWLGIDPARLEGRTLREVFGVDAYQSIEPHIIAALAGETVIYEREMIGADRRRHVEVTAVPHRDDRGSVQGLYVLISDISARKDIELARERSQKFLEGVINAIPQSVYVKDKQHRWMLFNQAFCDAMGQSRERLLGSTDADFLPAKIASENWIEDDRALLSGEPVVEEVALPFPNGETRWLLKSKRRVISPEGEAYVVGISTNVTTLKRTQDELREANDFLDSVVENIPHIVLVKDARDLSYLRFNKAGEDITGFSKEEVVGKTDYDLFPEQEADSYTSMDREVLLGGKLVEIPEETVHTRNKEVRLLLTRKLPVFDGQGIPRYLLGISEDITERKRAEEAIKASLREKEVLLKEVYHRVKNNMQIISSLLQLQSGYFEGGEVQRVFEESQMRIKSMALVHEKLYQTHDLARVDFDEYVRELVAMLMSSFGARGGRAGIEVHAEGMALDIDRAIPVGLILNELISNSIKHAFPNGRTGVVRVALSKTGDRISLTVRDNGVGLPEGFDPAATQSLGMRLVHVLAEQLGASIELRGTNGMECILTFDGSEQKRKEG